MVHRKSAYKLDFKNFSSRARREIFKENNLFRLNRRAYESSHHSIAEDLSDCECSDGSDTNSDYSYMPKQSVMKKFPSKEEINKAVSTDYRDEEHKESVISSALSRFRWPRGKGVLKVEASTGEYDLIPAIQPIDVAGRRFFLLSPKKHQSSPDLRSVGLRRSLKRTELPFRETSRNVPNWRQNQKVTFTNPPEQIINNFHHELRSKRTVPRVPTKHKSRAASLIDCRSCGETLRERA